MTNTRYEIISPVVEIQQDGMLKVGVINAVRDQCFNRTGDLIVHKPGLLFKVVQVSDYYYILRPLQPLPLNTRYCRFYKEVMNVAK